MSRFSSLRVYYDQLVSDKGQEAWLGEDPEEWEALVAGSQLSEQHRQLFDEVDAFRAGSVTQCPPRPTVDAHVAVVTPAAPPSVAPAAPVPPPPSMEGLDDLSEEDRASVLASRHPQARLQIIHQRRALDARTDLLPVLQLHQAQPAATNPARWTFPDGTVAMVKFDRKVWVEQTTLKVGQGATALWQRLAGVDEATAMTAVEALVTAPLQAPVTVQGEPAIVPTPPARARFVRRSL